MSRPALVFFLRGPYNGYWPLVGTKSEVLLIEYTCTVKARHSRVKSPGRLFLRQPSYLQFQCTRARRYTAVVTTEPSKTLDHVSDTEVSSCGHWSRRRSIEAEPVL